MILVPLIPDKFLYHMTGMAQNQLMSIDLPYIDLLVVTQNKMKHKLVVKIIT